MFLYHCKLNKLALTLQTTFAVYYILKFSYSRITLYKQKTSLIRKPVNGSRQISVAFFYYSVITNEY